MMTLIYTENHWLSLTHWKTSSIYIFRKLFCGRRVSSPTLEMIKNSLFAFQCKNSSGRRSSRQSQKTTANPSLANMPKNWVWWRKCIQTARPLTLLQISLLVFFFYGKKRELQYRKISGREMRKIVEQEMRLEWWLGNQLALLPVLSSLYRRQIFRYSKVLTIELSWCYAVV